MKKIKKEENRMTEEGKRKNREKQNEKSKRKRLLKKN